MSTSHHWSKKHFKNPTFCTICFKHITGSGKHGYRCTICSNAIHVMCKEQAKQDCSVIGAHTWVGEQVVGGPTCFVCKNEIVGNGKLSKVNGYICSNCGQRVHKHCRNAPSKCDQRAHRQRRNTFSGGTLPAFSEASDSSPNTDPLLSDRPMNLSEHASKHRRVRAHTANSPASTSWFNIITRNQGPMSISGHAFPNIAKLVLAPPNPASSKGPISLSNHALPNKEELALTPPDSPASPKGPMSLSDHALPNIDELALTPPDSPASSTPNSPDRTAQNSPSRGSPRKTSSHPFGISAPSRGYRASYHPGVAVADFMNISFGDPSANIPFPNMSTSTSDPTPTLATSAPTPTTAKTVQNDPPLRQRATTMLAPSATASGGSAKTGSSTNLASTNSAPPTISSLPSLASATGSGAGSNLEGANNRSLPNLAHNHLSLPVGVNGSFIPQLIAASEANDSPTVKKKSHKTQFSVNALAKIRRAFRVNPDSPPVGPIKQSSQPSLSNPLVRVNTSFVLRDKNSCVLDFLSELDGLKPSNNVQKKKQLKVAIESALLRLDKSMVKNALTLPQLFHLHTIQSKVAFSRARMHNYELLFSDFINIYKADDKHDANHIRTIYKANRILVYLKSHQCDPGNLLISSTPCPAILAKALAYFKAQEASHTGDEQDYAGPTSRFRLMEQVIAWGKIEEKDILVKQIKKFSALLEREQLIDGDLVIVEMPRMYLGIDTAEDCFVYGRYKREADPFGKMLEVYIDPSERQVIKLPFEKVFPFKLLEANADVTDTVQSLETLVHNPCTVFLSLIQKIVRKMTLEFIVTTGADSAVLKNCVKRSCTIRSLASVMDAKNLIEKLPTTKLFEDLDSTINEFVGIYTKYIDHQMEAAMRFEFPWGADEYFPSNFPTSIARIDKYRFTYHKPFIPTCKETAAELQKFPVTAYAAEKIHWYLLECKGAVDLLEGERRDILNGKKKREMTDWWLKLIRERVNEYLRAKHFDFDAVPDNYLEAMPTSIAAVKKNLRIVVSILSPTENESKKLQEKLIIPLKKEIYDKIDLFLANSEVVLQEQLQQHLPLCWHLLGPAWKEETSVLHAMLREQLKNLSPPLALWVKNTVEDMEYIKQMKILEQQWYGPEGGKKNVPTGGGLSHTVPITGLIMGRFSRVEVELRTVLDVWEYRMPKEESPIPSPSPLPSPTDAPALIVHDTTTHKKYFLNFSNHTNHVIPSPSSKRIPPSISPPLPPSPRRERSFVVQSSPRRDRSFTHLSTETIEKLKRKHRASLEPEPTNLNLDEIPQQSFSNSVPEAELRKAISDLTNLEELESDLNLDSDS